MASQAFGWSDCKDWGRGRRPFSSVVPGLSREGPRHRSGVGTLEQKGTGTRPTHLETVGILGCKLLPLFQIIMLVDGGEEKELGMHEKTQS